MVLIISVCVEMNLVSLWKSSVTEGCDLLCARMANCSVERPSYVFSQKEAALDFMTVMYHLPNN